jgi:hypothetical protein
MFSKRRIRNPDNNISFKDVLMKHTPVLRQDFSLRLIVSRVKAAVQ